MTDANKTMAVLNSLYCWDNRVCDALDIAKDSILKVYKIKDYLREFPPTRKYQREEVLSEIVRILYDDEKNKGLENNDRSRVITNKETLTQIHTALKNIHANIDETLSSLSTIPNAVRNIYASIDDPAQQAVVKLGIDVANIMNENVRNTLKVFSNDVMTMYEDVIISILKRQFGASDVIIDLLMERRERIDSQCVAAD